MAPGGPAQKEAALGGLAKYTHALRPTSQEVSGTQERAYASGGGWEIVGTHELRQLLLPARCHLELEGAKN
eukprot:8519451-Pyramimonas_sp.AAC.1